MKKNIKSYIAKVLIFAMLIALMPMNESNVYADTLTLGTFECSTTNVGSTSVQNGYFYAGLSYGSLLRTRVKYDLSSLDSGVVIGATLNIEINDITNDTANPTIEVCGSSEDDFSAYTTSLLPIVTSSLDSQLISSTGYYSYDVTSFVDQEFQNDQIVSFVLKGTDKIESNSSNGSYDSAAGFNTASFSLDITVVPFSSDATLSNLLPSTGALSPSFDSNTTDYSLDVLSSDSVMNFTPTANDAGYSSITVNGNNTESGSASSNISLSYGENNIDVVVTAEDGNTQKTYSIAVNRPLPKYSVSFDSQGGSAVTGLSGILEGSKISQPDSPTKEGYTFVGWYKEADCLNTWNFASDLVNAETTLYAKWTEIPKYSVNFDSQGGSAVTGQSGILEGSKISQPDSPTRDEYTFSGWYKEADCLNVWNFENDIVDSQTTIYAKWTEIPKYSVSFDSQGGSAVTGLSDILEGSKISQPESPTRDEYTFSGWYKEADCLNVWDFENDIVDSQMTLYAKWTEIPKYSVSFDSQGGSAVAGLSDILEGSKISQPESPTREGYTFSGWYREAECVNVWDFENNMVDAETTLYAKWTEIPKYSVTFDSQGGSAVAGLSGILKGSKISQPESPTRDGYTFSGWYREADCLNVWNFESDVVDAETTLYAKWTEIPKYSVSFDSQGGSAVIGLSGILEGSKISQPESPTRDGYTFSGWYKEADCLNVWNFENDIVDSQMTLYAKWTEIPKYSVSFDSQGGSAVTGFNDIQKGHKISSPDSPTRDGYTFSGWYKEADCLNVWDFASDVVDAETTLYAKWTEIVTYAISKIEDQTLVEKTAGYDSGSQERRSVTIRRTGKGNIENISIKLSGENKDLFEISQPEEKILNNSKESTKFEIRAKDSLAPGTYKAFITILADKMDDVTFAVIQVIKEVELSDECELISVSSPEKASISGERIDAEVENEVDSIHVDVEVSKGANWKLYSDYDCSKEIADKLMSLNVGENEAYLKIFAEKESETKTYTIRVKRNLPKDTSSPYIVETDPKNNQKNVDVSKDIEIIFSEEIFEGEKLNLISMKNESRVVEFSYMIEGRTLTINPKEDLKSGSSYVLDIPEYTVVDAVYNPLKNDYVLSFETKYPSEASSGGKKKSSSNEQEAKESAKVIVNGKEQTVGVEEINEKNGRKEVEVSIDSDSIKNRIGELADNKKDDSGNIIAVFVDTKDSDFVRTVLTGDVVKKMDEEKFKLRIETEKIDYIIPAKEVGIDQVASRLGVDKDSLEEIEIQVDIENLEDKLAEEIKANAEIKNYQLVFPPVEFKVTAKTISKKGEIQTTEISRFGNYVERVVQIPDDVDASKITTGIIYNPDGTFSHVPTVVFESNGAWFAEIKSLTNSSYSVIYNPIEVESVEGHWSENDVNDMASRLVIENVDGFKPDEEISRGEFAQYITKAIGIYRTNSKNKSYFDDVSNENEFYNAINIAFDYGIINGFEDGTFKPYGKITIEEAMAMYCRTMEIVKLNEFDKQIVESYKDINLISPWAYESVERALGSRIFNGKSESSIGPKEGLTQAEAITAIRRLLVQSNLINN